MRTPNLTAMTLLLCTALLTTVSCGAGDSTPVSGTAADSGITTTAVTEARVYDIAEIAAAISAGDYFSEPLTQNDAYMANHLFDFASLSDKIAACTAYVPAGINPEEILVFEMHTAEDTEAIVTRLKDYVAYQTEQYGDYKPSEVPKLDDPVIVTADNIVVYVIAKDSSAARDAVNTLLG